MAIGKVVVLMRRSETATLAEFMAEKPEGWQATLVYRDEGEEKLVRELEDAQCLVTLGGGAIPSRVFEGAKRLKLIQTRSQGIDHLPAKWILERGIFIANAGGANAIAVAEGTVLLILACLRRFPLLSLAVRDGTFGKDIDREGSHELYDKTVGIVGFGNVGRRVACLCFGFGANIVYYEKMFVPYALRADCKARPVSLDELLSISDIVTLHVPAFECNVGLIGAAQLARMKPTAHIINTSRGAIIDQDALVRALIEKRIAGAGLDVWEPEPPDPRNPLLQMPNVVATPHQVGRAWETGKRVNEAIWRNVVLVSEGKEPLNRIREF